MRHYEVESFVKGFLLFFSLMVSLYLFSEWQNYKEKHAQIDTKILSEMRLFSYEPLSGAFNVSFVPRPEKVKLVLELHKEAKDPYGLFEIPGSTKHLLKVSLAREKYQQRIDLLKQSVYTSISWYVPLIVIIAGLLAYYALYPLKKALQINEEFVRDILHDINTPLSALLINLNILQRRFGADKGFKRMENSIETIENLQSNLRSFLHRQPVSNARFALDMLFSQRLEYFRVLYPEITFVQELERGIVLETNLEAFTRIVDNILSNAGKYNTKRGEVRVRYEKERLTIEDTGIGIKYPERAFKRYYKEGERGLGLGLHIVKKLAKELQIDITLKSKKGKGTKMILKLSKVIVK